MHFLLGSYVHIVTRDFTLAQVRGFGISQFSGKPVYTLLIVEGPEAGRFVRYSPFALEDAA